MSIRTLKAILMAATAMLVLASCANNQSVPDLPTSLSSNQGILVARINVVGMSAMENARIDVDGVLRSSSLREGYIAIPLSPGNHRLNQIRAEGQLLSSNVVADHSPVQLAAYHAPVFIYVPGGSYTIHYTTLSVNRSFTIEAGKITNLGLMVYLPQEEKVATKDSAANKQRNYSTYYLNNNAETATFLNTNYPDLMRSLADRNIILEPGSKYLDDKTLPALRRAIAYHESKGPHVLSSRNTMVIYGRAGTIVALSKPATGNTPKVDVLDTGTLADVVGAVRRDEQFTFLTADARLITWDGVNMTRMPLPYHVQPVLMQALGQDELLVVDNRMRIMSTSHAGTTWQSYEQAISSFPRSDVEILPDQDGAYVVLGNRGLPESIQYVKPGEAPAAIVPPEYKVGIESGDRHVLVAREAGLFVLFDKPDYYFWSKASHRWETHSQPAGKCQPMKIGGDGRELTIECDGVTYRSDDVGASWSKPVT